MSGSGIGFIPGSRIGFSWLRIPGVVAAPGVELGDGGAANVLVPNPLDGNGCNEAAGLTTDVVPPIGHDVAQGA